MIYCSFENATIEAMPGRPQAMMMVVMAVVAKEVTHIRRNATEKAIPRRYCVP